MSDNTKTDTKASLASLKNQRLIQYPNHCTKCGGVGGDFTTSGDGWHEPMVEDWEDCSSCLGQNLNPLDITESLIDDEAEAHAEMMLEGGHPLLSKINELEVELHYEEMYQEHLEMEEVEREWLEREHERGR